MGRFHRYSFNNVLLILMQNPEATHVAGFHAWKKLGRTVKKGESGIAIVAPCRYKKKEENEAGEEESKGYALRGFTVAYVFDIEQTEGEPLPEFTAVNGQPGDDLARIKAYIEAHNDDPKPFVWKKTVGEILAKVGRARAALQACPRPYAWGSPNCALRRAAGCRCRGLRPAG